ncbi:MAG: hypothetical protein GEU95_25315 [Rhizobiales bacterium]|nr:hypothetical protein [Hyphomicrobiales bacterium]
MRAGDPLKPLQRRLEADTERIRSAQAIARAIIDGRKSQMPELGGKALAGEVGVALMGIKQALETLRLDAAAAVTELQEEITTGKEGVKRIREEAAAVRNAFAEIIGNERVATQAEAEKTARAGGGT